MGWYQRRVHGGSLSELPRRPTQKMKLFALLTLAAVVVADYEKEMMTKWIKMKAMESCWGSENIKLYTVELKKAIAKCSNEDAPELSLQVRQRDDQPGQQHGHAEKHDGSHVIVDEPRQQRIQLCPAILNQQRQLRQLHGQNEDDDDEDENEEHDEVKLPER